MELDELKLAWTEENKRLDARVSLNEKVIREMKVDKMIGQFEKLLGLSLTGRTLAFIYFLISLGLASSEMTSFAYSFPALAAALAMFMSYVSHLAIKRPEYDKISVIELQKKVCEFRLHTASHSRYDIAIISFWLITLVPVALKSYFNIAIYGNTNYTLTFIAGSIFIIIWNIFSARKIYKRYHDELSTVEGQLATIAGFEKE
jgi:hypothetical protein